MKRSSRVISVVELYKEGNRVNVAKLCKFVVKSVKPSSSSKSVQRSGEASNFYDYLDDNFKKRSDNELADEASVPAENTLGYSSVTASSDIFSKDPTDRVTLL